MRHTGFPCNVFDRDKPVWSKPSHGPNLRYVRSSIARYPLDEGPLLQGWIAVISGAGTLTLWGSRGLNFFASSGVDCNSEAGRSVLLFPSPPNT